MISPFGSPSIVETTLPFSSIPFEYPFVGKGSLDSTYDTMFFVNEELNIANKQTADLKKMTGAISTFLN